MGGLLNVLSELGYYFKKRLAIILRLSMAVYVRTGYGSYLYTMNSDDRDRMIEEALGIIDEADLGEVDENGELEISVYKLRYHNVQAGVFTVLSGFLPFIFLPLAILVLNSSVLGMTIASAADYGVTASQLFVYGILPHGVFEIPATVIGAACGARLCLSVIKRILKRSDNLELRYDISYTLLFFILFAVPLYIVAAPIEAWITPDLLFRYVFGPLYGVA